MAVMMAIMMGLLLLFVGIVIDTNWSAIGLTELQVASDHAARASLIHYATNVDEPDRDRRLDDAAIMGKAVFEANTVGGKSRPVSVEVIDFGRAFTDGDGNPVFNVGARPYNSARAQVSLETDSTSISSFFGNLHGVEEFSPATTAVASIERVDVVLALDVSRSMNFVVGGHDTFPPGGTLVSAPVAGARWFDMLDESKIFLEKFARNNAMARIGLVTFGGGLPSAVEPGFANTKSRQEFPLGPTRDTQKFNDLLQRYSGGPLGLGTSLSDAVYDAIANFEGPLGDPEANRVMVLLSDGQQWFADQIDTLDTPETAALVARDKGIKIHCIYYSGPPTGGDDLYNLASLTGGEFFNAANGAELNAAMDRITKLLPIKLVQ